MSPVAHLMAHLSKSGASCGALFGVMRRARDRVTWSVGSVHDDEDVHEDVHDHEYEDEYEDAYEYGPADLL